jgi:hypothetical protein
MSENSDTEILTHASINDAHALIVFHFIQGVPKSKIQYSGKSQNGHSKLKSVYVLSVADNFGRAESKHCFGACAAVSLLS